MFKDSVEVVALTDPLVDGVTLYLSVWGGGGAGFGGGSRSTLCESLQIAAAD